MIVAIIPARGGSKLLPRKNVLPFAGRPLLAWSVLAARASLSVGATWVSTDDEEIAATGTAHGAQIVRRPKELAGDEIPTIDVIRHALLHIRAQGLVVDAVMTLQPTNPMRPLNMIEQAIDEFRSTPCDSLVSVSQRALKVGSIHDGYYIPNYTFGQQSRLTSPLTYENGLLYITRAGCIEDGSLCGERIRAFLSPRPYDEIDIDDAIDLKIGEAIAMQLLKQLGY